MAIKDKIYRYLEKNQVNLNVLALLGVILLYLNEVGIFYPILSLKKMGALMWLAAIFLLRLEAAVSLAVGFILLGFAAVIFTLGERQPAEDLGIFVYLLFVIGAAQRFFEFIKLSRGRHD